MEMSSTRQPPGSRADPLTAASTAHGRRPSLGRFVGIFAVSALSLLTMAWILPGLSVEGWTATVVGVGVIAVLNGLLWPLVARFAARLIMWTLGLLGLVANGLILLLTDEPWR